jgi:orotidine-5'-phosphate decarboxylase
MIAKDKLIVALDVDTTDHALALADELRGSVGMFKIGMQLFTAAGLSWLDKSSGKANRVFLDLKYHDIPNTVAMAAVEATRLGVTLFNIHTSGGRDMMTRAAEAVAETAARENLTAPKVLGVTLLTSIDAQTLAGNRHQRWTAGGRGSVGSARQKFQARRRGRFGAGDRNHPTDSDAERFLDS